MEKLAPLGTVGENIKWCLVMENYMAAPQLKIDLLSRNSTFEYIPKRTEGKDLKRYLYNHIHRLLIQNS